MRPAAELGAVPPHDMAYRDFRRCRLSKMKTDDNRLAAFHLLEMGTLVPFRVVKEEVTPGTDAGEFAVRIELEMNGEEEAEPADVAAWGALGFTC